VLHGVLKMDESPQYFLYVDAYGVWILRPRDDVGGPADRGRSSLFLPPGAGNPSYATGEGWGKERKKAKESRVVPHPKLNPGCATDPAQANPMQQTSIPTRLTARAIWRII